MIKRKTIFVFRSSIFMLVFLLLFPLSACAVQRGHDYMQNSEPNGGYRTNENASSLETSPVKTENPGEDTPQSSELKGIIVVKRETNLQHTIQTITVSSIDPSSGAVTIARRFQIPLAEYSLVSLEADLLSSRQYFNSDLSKVVVQTRPLSDGSIHVGWFDEKGTFTDVTAKVTDTGGDFSSAVYHRSPRFGFDGFFYYGTFDARAITSVIGSVYKVPSNDLRRETAQSVPLPEYRDNKFYVQPDGSITWHSNNRYSDASMTYSAPWHTFDWVNTNSYLGPALVLSGVSYNQIYLHVYGSDAQPLLPENSTRLNFNAVVSPDGKQVAFLSKQQTGTDPVDLFIVPIEGGEPIKISTNYNFYRETSPPQLFMWR